MPNDISVQLAPAVRAGSDTATDCKVVSTSEPPAISRARSSSSTRGECPAFRLKRVLTDKGSLRVTSRIGSETHERSNRQ